MKFTCIGIGWLGLSFARQAIANGHSVMGTVTSQDKAASLQHEAGIKTIKYDCYTPFPIEHCQSFFQHATVIINIAAGRRNLNAEKYYQAISQLVNTAVNHGCTLIIFVSTTSVFGGLNGKLDNLSSPSPLTESAKAHHAIETFLLNYLAKKSCVLRLGGLVGPNPDNGYRHPIYSLAKRKKVSASNQPVNLIHKQDVIKALFALSENSMTGHAFNLVSNEHPSKKDYYGWCAQRLDIDDMVFEESKSPGRFIDSRDTQKALNIQLEYSTPFDMLDV